MRTCTIDGCDKPVYVVKRGWCQRHYGAWLRHGDPLVNNQPRGTASERFWWKVDRRSADECWPWTAFIDPDGYGMFGIGTSDSVRAHRFAYEDHFGLRIPDGLVLDHNCHNRDVTCLGGDECLHRRCVNPAHLSPATPTTNVFTSRLTPAAMNKEKEVCIRNHPLLGDNLIIDPKTGKRNCRTCKNDARRQRRAAQRAAKKAA